MRATSMEVILYEYKQHEGPEGRLRLRPRCPFGQAWIFEGFNQFFRAPLPLEERVVPRPCGVVFKSIPSHLVRTKGGLYICTSRSIALTVIVG